MKELVVILGMHRSGTSVTAHISQCMGAYLGEEEELIGAYPGNPDGHFENKGAVSIHEEVLRFCGKEWYSLEAPQLDWKHPRIIKAAEEIKALIEKLLEKHEVAAVKDPRTSVLLPLWERVLQELEVEVHYIWVFRNPLEVMESLRKRDGYSREHGLLLWMRYNLSILKFLQGKEYLLVHYRDVLEDPHVLEKLSRLFHCQLDTDLRCELAQVIKHGYSHSRYSYEDVRNTGNGLLSGLYGALLENQETEADIVKWEKEYWAAITQIEASFMDEKVRNDIGCLAGKEIVIYGAGNCGQRAAGILQELGFLDFCFCDKDACKQGKELMGRRIFSIKEMEERTALLVIVAIQEEEARKEAEYTCACIPGIGLLSFSRLETLGKGANRT